MYVCVCMCVFVCMYVSVCMYVCINLFPLIDVSNHVRRVHTHKHAYTNNKQHTHMLMIWGCDNPLRVGVGWDVPIVKWHPLCSI